jgi:hypothetical protein
MLLDRSDVKTQTSALSKVGKVPNRCGELAEEIARLKHRAIEPNGRHAVLVQSLLYGIGYGFRIFTSE